MVSSSFIVNLNRDLQSIFSFSILITIKDRRREIAVADAASGRPSTLGSGVVDAVADRVGSLRSLVSKGQEIPIAIARGLSGDAVSE